MAITVTQRQVEAALKASVVVAETIRDLGEIPSGHLYANLAGCLDLQTYQGIIKTLKGVGLVEEQNYLLRWIGPTK